MAYLFESEEQSAAMCGALGIPNADALFDQIPEELRLQRLLNLPPAVSEMQLEQELAQRLRGEPSPSVCFLGGGAYDHFIPAVVDEITSRGEFYTAYTPYQAEASQGTLQAFYEYQTLICQLTGMEVSNASLYEGATCVSEAVFMAMRVTGRHQRVVVAGSIHPHAQEVLRTYLAESGTEIITVPVEDGLVDAAALEAAVDDRTCAVVLQSPNFFGCLEDVARVTAAAHGCGALMVLSFDPIAPGMLKRPGDYGVDIAVAEGQPLGIPLQFGGPYLGIFTCREKYVRKMPGRLIGRTTDRSGKPCFVLNLQAREQHIRRDKATSNICTNQGLMALRATVHLAVLGREGYQRAARLSHARACYAADVLTGIDGVEPCYSAPWFREFAIRTPLSAAELLPALASRGYSVGPSLAEACGESDDTAFLVAFTEQRTSEEIDGLAEAIRAELAACRVGQTA